MCTLCCDTIFECALTQTIHTYMQGMSREMIVSANGCVSDVSTLAATGICDISVYIAFTLTSPRLIKMSNCSYYNYSSEWCFM